MKKSPAIAVILLLVAATSGCHAPLQMRSFAHPDADYEFYRKVGVLPFQSEADDPLAGEKVTEQYVTEVLIGGGVQVMDPGQFRAVVSAVRGVPNPATVEEYSPEDYKRIGQAAEVQGIFAGVVHDYRMMQLGGEQYPVLSMTVKFIDAPTGTVVWQNSVTARGGPNLPIISAGESFIMGELVQKVSRKVVEDFYRKAGRR